MSMSSVSITVIASFARYSSRISSVASSTQSAFSGRISWMVSSSSAACSSLIFSYVLSLTRIQWMPTLWLFRIAVFSTSS